MTYLAKVLIAPCPFCRYNGPGFYQVYTHKIGCPWREIGGYEQREKYLLNILPIMMEVYFNKVRRRIQLREEAQFEEIIK